MGWGSRLKQMELELSPNGNNDFPTRLDTLNEQLAEKAQQVDLNAQSTRIDNLVANVGNTSGNSEIVDIRVSGTGVTYTAAGGNLRALESQIINMPDITQYTLSQLNNVSNGKINTDGTIVTPYYTDYYVGFYDVSQLKSIILKAYMAGGAALPRYAFYSCATSAEITAGNTLTVGTYTSNTDKTLIIPNDCKLLGVMYYQAAATIKAKSKNIKSNLDTLYQNCNNLQSEIDTLNSDVYMDSATFLTKTAENSYLFNTDGSHYTFSTYCSRVYAVDTKYYKVSIIPNTINGFKPYILCFADDTLTNPLAYFTYTSGTEITFEIPDGTNYITVNTENTQVTTFKAIEKVSKLSKLDSKYTNRKISGVGDSLSTSFKYLDKCVTELGMSKGGVQNGGACVSGTGDTAFWKDSIINGLSTDTKIICILGGTNDGAQNKTIGDISLTNYDTNTFVGAYNVMLSKIYYKYLGLASGYYGSISYAGVTKLTTPVVAIPIFLITPPLTLDPTYESRISTVRDAVKQIGKLWGLPVIDSNDIFANPITWTSSDTIHGVMDLFNYLGDKIVAILKTYEASMTFFDTVLGQQYTITTSFSGGTVAVNSLARQGDTVQFVITGTYSTISVKDASNNTINVTTIDVNIHSYSFVMPGSNATITVS